MEILIDIGIKLFIIVVVLVTVLLHVAYAVYFERKVIGRMQARLGPTETGPLGLLQPIADLLKLLIKEDIMPSNIDKVLYVVAPAIVVMTSMTAVAAVPLFEGFGISNINIALLFILAVASINVYGIVLAGWSSNSKYSFFGGMRSSAQLISYELAMSLSLASVVLMAGSLNLSEIVRMQHESAFGIYAIPQFVAFVIFIISAFAETNRAPFDIPEAETELVAGYFTEYSGFRFALFFLAEYISMLVMSSLCAICFLGGWTIPHYITSILPFLEYVPGIVWFLIKVYAFMFLYFWVRATLPRYRYDQLMSIGWKYLMPIAFLNFLVTAFILRWF